MARGRRHNAPRTVARNRECIREPAFSSRFPGHLPGHNSGLLSLFTWVFVLLYCTGTASTARHTRRSACL